MIIRVTSEGRFQIPAPFRKRMGIVDGDQLNAEVTDNGEILIVPIEPRCKICAANDPVNVNGIPLCSNCIQKLKSAL